MVDFIGSVGKQTAEKEIRAEISIKWTVYSIAAKDKYSPYGQGYHYAGKHSL